METNNPPVWATVRSLALEIERKMHPVLWRVGLTLPQYVALSAFAEGGLTSADVARVCHVTPQTASQVTKTLEDMGFLVRNSVPGQGRGMVADVTPLGQRILGMVRTAIAPVEREIEELAGERFAVRADRVLTKLSRDRRR